ncbi:MAG: DUF3450 domain-containing protein [Thermodesulfobacteriota bacterium]|nr:DUF3450 domain-containing protein [Thermodesulfobacteriota bacterium]
MHIKKKFQKITGFAALLIVVNLASSQAEDGVTDKIEKQLDQSITTRQQSQKELDQWEQERIRLQVEFEGLTRKNEALVLQDKTLKKQVAARKAMNASLIEREQESRKIAQEIIPFLENLYIRISEFIALDVPFLSEERKGRINRLKKVLSDMEVGPAEKFRKFMETLLIEAEYGNSIEVYQEKIMIENEEILGDVFRLGRISLFFLSLDQTLPAYYNVADKKWTVLDDRYAADIHAAIEMGSKRRATELLCLPLGKIAAK